MPLDPKTAADTTDLVESNAKIIRESPARQNFKDALGKRRAHYLKDNPDGTWELDVPRDDPRAVAAVKDLGDKSRRLYSEHTQEFAARRKPDMARMRTKDGRTVTVHAENEGWLHKKTGAVPAPVYRGVGVYAGPNGMLFRDIAGYWYPTGRTCLGTPIFGDGIAHGPQPDPDGNVWAEANGEWEIVEWAES